MAILRLYFIVSTFFRHILYILSFDSLADTIKEFIFLNRFTVRYLFTNYLLHIYIYKRMIIFVFIKASLKGDK